MQLTRKPYKELSRHQVENLLRLQDMVWPKPEKIARPMADRVDSYFSDCDEEYEIFLLEDGDTLLAHAEIFPRTILTSAGKMLVMALASVCSPPDRRGEGYGKRIVQAAFGQVDNGRFFLSLFQTRVPDFYEKLGARKVLNTFINSKGKDGVDFSPWWNPHAMIYPGAFVQWPAGEIDLLGPGY
jgi:predicted GNAT family N-acyltransferase